ncbi:cysteine dioxygenase family protein [Vibrio sp. S4M6]|uniref:cysteine dioxygenase n=1 Tax=Vibrio sinus TaxID=2946865 RepID=UPI00202AB44D|nr:cysteine dioxygenase family protein [Vibrio sinus]MCL9782907.1 cysteine dioxygenase family protein [Vibrio sinus]
MSQSSQNVHSMSVLPLMLNEHESLTYCDFIQQLEHTTKPLSLSTIRFVLDNLYLSEHEIQELAEFKQNSYCRKRLFKNEHCEVLMLSWLNGQRSKIHDHLGTACGVKVLSGQATETVFERAPNQHIFATQSHVYEEGSVTASMDEDIHQISNLQDNNQPLVTIHIYSPPLKQFRFYKLESAETDWFDSETMSSWIYEI